jgi:large subunit ribosomal protein L30
MALIAVIRIAGMLHKTYTVAETFDRLRLSRKYCCVLIQADSERMGMIPRIKDFVAYGPITEEVLVKLVKERGRMIGDSKARVSETDAKKIAKDLLAGKKLEDLKVKPFFALHPPRKGIDSKLPFGIRKGVLGNNKENINKLIERML